MVAVAKSPGGGVLFAGLLPHLGEHTGPDAPPVY
jgi:hypothetical protein